jgi:hypothetical protein
VRYLFCFLLSSDSPFPPEGSILSLSIQCLVYFLAVGGITVSVDIRSGKRCGFYMHLLQKSYFFRFLTSDSISQPQGEGDFAYHYTIEMQVVGSLTSLFLFVYKCGYLLALTVYVLSRFRCFAVVLLLFLFFFLFTGCWLVSSVRVLSFFCEVFVLFSYKVRLSFAPRREASCP